MSRMEVDSHWNEILEVINRVEARSESIVVIGDLNRLVGDIIPGNNHKKLWGRAS